MQTARLFLVPLTLLCAVAAPTAFAQGVASLESASYQHGFVLDLPANGLSIMRSMGSAQRQISDDGRYVVFESAATNLVAGVVDENGINDVFLYDRTTGLTRYVSLTHAGVPAGGSEPTMDGSGQIIVYTSTTNPENGLPTAFASVYLRNLGAAPPLTADAILVSRPTAGLPINGDSFNPTLTRDGTLIAFASRASTLVPNDDNLVSDVFAARFNQITGDVTPTVPISGNPLSGTLGNAHSDSPSIATARGLFGDGLYIAFRSSATNLSTDVANTGNNIYLYSRVSLFPTGQETRVRLVDRPIGGITQTAIGSDSPVLVAVHGDLSDRVFIAFSSTYSNLEAGDGNNARDILYGEIGEPIRIVSLYQGMQANGDSYFPVFSGDGRKLAFSSVASNLAPSDVNGQEDVFLYNTSSLNSSFVYSVGMVSLSPQGIQGQSSSSCPSLSYDGSFIAFDSSANNWPLSGGVQANGVRDVFVATYVLPLFANGFED